MTGTGLLQQRLTGRRPQVLLTLGSGLGAMAGDVEDAIAVSFEDVGLPAPRVPGHAGRLVIGRLAGVEVIVQQGRLHLYEGVAAGDVAAVVRAAAAVGVSTFVVTNASGGLYPTLAPGDLVALRDHLNLTGASPLIPVAGAPSAPAFVDMSEAYDARARATAVQVAGELGERLVEGVYAGLVGPAYETPAEAAMLRTLGADVVGMSTVIEVLAARAAGLRVLGLSLVTNVHGSGATDHADVLDVAGRAGPRLAALVQGVLPRLAGDALR